MVGALGKLEDLQRGQDARHHHEHARRVLQRGEQLVVERRLGLGRKLLQETEENRDHDPPQQDGADEEQRGDGVVRDRVLVRAHVEQLEHRVDQVLQEVGRVRRGRLGGDRRGRGGVGGLLRVGRRGLTLGGRGEAGDGQEQKITDGLHGRGPLNRASPPCQSFRGALICHCEESRRGWGDEAIQLDRHGALCAPRDDRTNWDTAGIFTAPAHGNDPAHSTKSPLAPPGPRRKVRPPMIVPVLAMFSTMPWWAWVGFLAFVAVMLALDLGVFNRRPHVVSLKEALAWCAVWFGLAMAFNLLLALKLPATTAGNPALEFFTGYIIELCLSVDNVFVFIVVFKYFRVEPRHQHRVLFWGVLGAVVMRAIFIFAGVSLINSFHWIIYLFGAFLVFTGVKLALPKNDGGFEPENNFAVRLARRLVPVTDQFEGGHFFTHVAGKLHATP